MYKYIDNDIQMKKNRGLYIHERDQIQFSTNLSVGKLRLLQLSKMQKYANSKRLSSAT